MTIQPGHKMDENELNRRTHAALDYAQQLFHAGRFRIGIDLIEGDVIVIDRQSDLKLSVPFDELRELASLLTTLETQLYLRGLTE